MSELWFNDNSKNGERENGVQRLKCADCGYNFTFFYNTLLEKQSIHGMYG